jgi:4-hydroxy-tetrahydrodipicolinate synthase
MAEAQPIFTGVGVALLTLFDQDGALDASSTAGHAARLVDEGARAVVVAGTTGEAASLEREERIELLDAVRNEVGKSAPVIAGTGAPSARQAVRLSREAADRGADGLLVLSPQGSTDPRPYYAAVAEAVDVPVLAYHFPQVSPPGIPVESLGELPVEGLKDSSGNAQRLILSSAELSSGLYTGQHSLLHLASRIGCSGAILGVANVDLGRCLRAWEGDALAQREVVTGNRGLERIDALKRRLAHERSASPVLRLG